MFNKIDYIMVTVSDMDRSVEFYRYKLGLALKFASPGWTEFQTGATTLALHGGGQPGERRDKGDLGAKYAGTCSIGFSVENLAAVFDDLVSRGVQFVMPPTLQEQEGIRLAVCLDPDNLPISIAEAVHKAEGQYAP